MPGLPLNQGVPGKSRNFVFSKGESGEKKDFPENQ